MVSEQQRLCQRRRVAQLCRIAGFCGVWRILIAMGIRISCVTSLFGSCNGSNNRTAIWYLLDERFFIGGRFGPTVPAGWDLVDGRL